MWEYHQIHLITKYVVLEEEEEVNFNIRPSDLLDDIKPAEPKLKHGISNQGCIIHSALFISDFYKNQVVYPVILSIQCHSDIKTNF